MHEQPAVPWESVPGRIWQRSLCTVKRDPLFYAEVCTFSLKSRSKPFILCEVAI